MSNVSAKILGIIPARYASTRFPGKPLVDIKGKTMIQRVYEQAKQANLLSDVIVATDDDRILKHVISFGGKALLTSSHHQTGTDRCAEVAQLPEIINQAFEAIINIQGDEPFINPEQINQVAQLFNNSNTQLGTLVKEINNLLDLENPNLIKVVKDLSNKAIYFSRSAIPYQRNKIKLSNNKSFVFYKHIGIYGYRTKTLLQISKLKQTPLEQTESLEQLRWIENGYEIQVAETTFESHSVDIPEDLQKFV